MRHKLTTDEFIKRAKEIYGDKYEYSKADYKGTKIPITITCLKHGDFTRTPNEILTKRGCQKCGYERIGKYHFLDKDEFIKRAKKIHGDKYDYSKVIMNGVDKEVTIICPIHGEFKQTPEKHINRKHGCPKCGIEKRSKKRLKSKEEFIKKAKLVHSDKYDYSNSKYVGINKNIAILCPIHGEFKQSASSHLNGSGCPKCKQSHLENEIENFLKDNDIKFECQKKFNWLGKQSLDFYLSDYNIGIECQGSQHFLENHFFEPLKTIKNRDFIKNKLCNENNIKLLYYSDLGIEYPYKVFEDKNKLLVEINS